MPRQIHAQICHAQSLAATNRRLAAVDLAIVRIKFNCRVPLVVRNEVVCCGKSGMCVLYCFPLVLSSANKDHVELHFLVYKKVFLAIYYLQTYGVYSLTSC